MNTQSLDLNKMGLAPMQFGEMQEMDGGLINSVWGIAKWAIGELIDFQDGFMSAQATIKSNA